MKLSSGSYLHSRSPAQSEVVDGGDVIVLPYVEGNIEDVGLFQFLQLLLTIHFLVMETEKNRNVSS